MIIMKKEVWGGKIKLANGEYLVLNGNKITVNGYQQRFRNLPAPANDIPVGI